MKRGAPMKRTAFARKNNSENTLAKVAQSHASKAQAAIIVVAKSRAVLPASAQAFRGSFPKSQPVRSEAHFSPRKRNAPSGQAWGVTSQSIVKKERKMSKQNSNLLRCCSVPGCLGAVEGRGLCNKHYLRMRKIEGPLPVIDKSLPFREQAMSLLSYDKDSGLMTWRRRWYGAAEGSVVSRAGVNGYVSVGLFGKDRYVHRLAWLFETGVEPVEIDHIDRCRSNNRFTNLRDVSHSVNVQNAKEARITNRTGILGVCFREDLGKWQAGIMTDGKYKYLGVYLSPDEAGDAYITAKKQLHAGYVE